MKLTIATKRKLEGYIFTLPGFIFTVVILGFPLIYNLILSMQNLNVRNFNSGTAIFVGLENYRFLFNDTTFRFILRNTFVFTIGSLVFQFTIGFILALFFSKKFKLAGPIRGLLLIAYMMPVAVTAMLGRNMFGVSAGVINDILFNLGIISKPVQWLITKDTAMKAVIAVNCWIGIPFNMLLLSAGLTNISNKIYDSADVDGANCMQKFFYITLPLMKPAIFAVIMLGFIYTFKAFDLMFIMTNGGPMNSTDVLGTYAYRLSFTQFEFSLGAATGMVLFMCLFIIGLFYLLLISGEED